MVEKKKMMLGPTGELVRANVARLRGSMQFKELAERLERAGRPIPPLGLRRIEAGERRVDADDLTALAVVFGVSPLTLLLPPDGVHDLASGLTGVPDRLVAHNTMWMWALGERPLDLPDPDLETWTRTRREFQLRAKPTIQDPTILGRPLSPDADFDPKEQDRRNIGYAVTQGMPDVADELRRYYVESYGEEPNADSD